MRGSDIIKPGMMEDLLIKSVKPGEIVLTDPSNDEIGIIQKADQTERDKILAKIEDDIKDEDSVNETVQDPKAMMIEGMRLFVSGSISEKLKPSMGLDAYIDDFVHSDNERFAGKSKEDRINMAKGAYYGATKESCEMDDEEETIVEKYDPKTDLEAGYQYYVIDKQGKNIVGRYKTGTSASNAVDKKDNAYGAYRYSRRRIDSMLNENN